MQKNPNNHDEIRVLFKKNKIVFCLLKHRTCTLYFLGDRSTPNKIILDVYLSWEEYVTE